MIRSTLLSKVSRPMLHLFKNTQIRVVSTLRDAQIGAARFLMNTLPAKAPVPVPVKRDERPDLPTRGRR